jgi:hypothetical protein
MNDKLAKAFQRFGLSEAESKLAAAGPLCESVNPANHDGRTISGGARVQHDGSAAYSEIHKQNEKLRGGR